MVSTVQTQQKTITLQHIQEAEFIVTLQRYLLSLALHGSQEFVLKAVQDLSTADLPILHSKIWSLLEKTAKRKFCDPHLYHRTSSGTSTHGFRDFSRARISPSAG